MRPCVGSIFDLCYWKYRKLQLHRLLLLLLPLLPRSLPHRQNRNGTPAIATATTPRLVLGHPAGAAQQAQQYL